MNRPASIQSYLHTSTFVLLVLLLAACGARREYVVARFDVAHAAVAHHHGKVKGNRDKLIKDANDFAFGEYSTCDELGRHIDNRPGDL